MWVSVSDQMKRYGRKPKLTPEKLLEAVREYASTESSLLGEKLRIHRSTVWRCIQKIPKEEIERTVREVAEQELKPAETEFEVFVQISIVKEYNKKLMAKVVDKYRRRMLHMLHRICVYLNKHPARLTLEDGGGLIRQVELEQRKAKEERKIPFESVRELKRGLRSWFSRKGISRRMMTSKGIESPKQEHDEERAHARLTPKQRARFMHVLEEKVRDYPEDEKLEWLTLPKYLYYTGTRIAGTLESRIENVEKTDADIWKHYVIDKYDIKWRKRITGELKNLINRLLELKGNPQDGLFFAMFSTFSNIESRRERVGEVFKEVYEKAEIPRRIWEGMPCHIWRHTACQDLLEATNYNFELVAEILGWKSVDTMKKYYGAIGDRTIDKALKEAMGQKIEWETKEFKF